MLVNLTVIKGCGNKCLIVFKAGIVTRSNTNTSLYASVLLLVEQEPLTAILGRFPFILLPRAGSCGYKGGERTSLSSPHTLPVPPFPSLRALVSIFTLMLPHFCSDLSFETQTCGTSGTRPFYLGVLWAQYTFNNSTWNSASPSSALSLPCHHTFLLLAQIRTKLPSLSPLLPRPILAVKYGVIFAMLTPSQD